MLSPNLAFILVSELLFTGFGLVFNLNFVQSADLYALNNDSFEKFNKFLRILPGSTRTSPALLFMELPYPEPTWIFAFQHNTRVYSQNCTKLSYEYILWEDQLHLNDILLLMTTWLSSNSLVQIQSSIGFSLTFQKACYKQF